MVDHIFIHCRSSVRLWGLVKDWMGIPELIPSQWVGLTTSDWWRMMSDGASSNRKAMTSLTLLVSWEI
jgi:hypothetical protein